MSKYERWIIVTFVMVWAYWLIWPNHSVYWCAFLVVFANNIERKLDK